jgi:hypothetical protein
MKVVSAIKICASLLGLLAFGILPARGQSEVDPDRFDSPTTEPSRNATTADREVAFIQYNGTFTLPYSVQCNGKNLAPGKYSLLFRSDGKQGQATLNQKGQAIGIAGAVHKPSHNRRSTAVIVEVNGTAWRLSAIQMAEMDLVLDPELPAKNSSEGKPIRIKALPLTPAPPKQ